MMINVYAIGIFSYQCFQDSLRVALTEVLRKSPP